MATEYLSIEEIKEQSYILANVDVKFIKPTLLLCQDQYIAPILGTALFLDIKVKLALDDTLSSYTAYKTLLDDYIKPTLLYYIMTEFLDASTYKMANAGTLVMNTENTQAASMNDIFKLQGKFKSKADFYAQRLTDFLSVNGQTYPLYFTQDRLDALYPKGTSYDSGFYLGNSRIEGQSSYENWLNWYHKNNQA